MITHVPQIYLVGVLCLEVNRYSRHKVLKETAKVWHSTVPVLYVGSLLGFSLLARVLCFMLKSHSPKMSLTNSRKASELFSAARLTTGM